MGTTSAIIYPHQCHNCLHYEGYFNNSLGFAQRIITMPQVIRGVRSNSEPNDNTGTPGSPRANENRRVTFDHGQDREESEAYYDSRAATQYEFQRRASTLQTYYCEHPELLPQLPFTFRHGFKRWRLGGYIALMVFDACVVPIMLYYAMTFGGHVEGSITFAVITAIWGGPTYVEFAIRSLRLIKQQRFYKPLGVDKRWAFDITNWILVLAITVVTAILIVGAAPHDVFLRVLSMPGPAILLHSWTRLSHESVQSFGVEGAVPDQFDAQGRAGLAGDILYR